MSRVNYFRYSEKGKKRWQEKSKEERRRGELERMGIKEKGEKGWEMGDVRKTEAWGGGETRWERTKECEIDRGE